MRPIVLTGPPAVGKTTVGQLVAKVLDVPFLDTDSQMETFTDRSVWQLITDEGEAWFRGLETRTLHHMMSTVIQSGDRAVISTGAGIVESPANRMAIMGAADAICLFVPLTVVFHRLTDDGTRPLWAGPDGHAALRERWTRRAPLYQEVATAGIVNAYGHPELVAERIIRLIERRPT